jgi:hypothetical protein
MKRAPILRFTISRPNSKGVPISFHSFPCQDSAGFTLVSGLFHPPPFRFSFQAYRGET